ncbi:MAG: heavy metal translocating P-type ATPase, partial [Polyangiaceae bacterium]
MNRAPPDATSLHSITIPVGGMSCTACSGAVTSALTELDGVSDVSVSLVSRSATISFDPARVGVDALVRAIDDSGYDAVKPEGAGGAVAAEAALERAAREEANHLAKRAGLALALAIVAMVVSMPLMSSGSAHEPCHECEKGMDPLMGAVTGVLDAPLRAALPWLYKAPPEALGLALAFITTIVLGVLGRHFFVRAARALKRRTADMNTLVALGAGTATLYSLAAWLVPSFFFEHGLRPDAYWEAAVFIVALVMVGQALEARARARASRAIDHLVSMQPARALLEENGTATEVALETVRAGDVLVVRPGERVPVDGVIVSGTSALDESLLTGESMPVTRGEGDVARGGALNGDGALRIRATGTARESALARIVHLLAEAQRSRAPIQDMADRVA